MDLLARVVVGIVVVVVILLVLYYALRGSFFSPVSEQQAEALITADLQRTYPGAAVNVTNATPSNYSGSWHVSTDVVLNATSVCPSFYAYTFDYPQFGFVYRVQNTYTNNCKIYGLQSNRTFIIASYPIAITWASTRIPAIVNFINSYKNLNITTSAVFESAATYNSTVYSNVWNVTYRTSAGTKISALFSQQDGTLIATST